MGMLMERDEGTGATYYTVGDGVRARTVHVSDLIMVDVDDDGAPVGVEFAVALGHLPRAEIKRLLGSFPTLQGVLPVPATRRPRDLNRLAASIVDDATREPASEIAAVATPLHVKGLVITGVSYRTSQSITVTEPMRVTVKR